MAHLVLLRRVALCADQDPDDPRVAVPGGGVQGGVAVLNEVKVRKKEH